MPALLISPYARRGYVDSTELDFTSILRFIEDNYQLAPLATRDARTNSLAGAFDFAQAARPPHMISATREVAQHAEPRRDIIYLCYSAMVVLAGIIIGGAIIAGGGRHSSLTRDQHSVPQEGTL